VEKESKRTRYPRKEEEWELFNFFVERGTGWPKTSGRGQPVSFLRVSGVNVLLCRGGPEGPPQAGNSSTDLLIQNLDTEFKTIVP